MSTFSNYKLFEAVSVRASDDKLVFLNTSNNNISLHSSNGSSTDVDTLSIKNIMNKSTSVDDGLHICSYDGSTVSPMITIKYNTDYVDLNNKLIKNVAYPVDDQDASNIKYMNDTITNLSLPPTQTVLNTSIYDFGINKLNTYDLKTTLETTYATDDWINTKGYLTSNLSYVTMDGHSTVSSWLYIRGYYSGYSIYSNGSITSAGGYFLSSDKRIKKNITRIDPSDALNLIKKFDVYNYNVINTDDNNNIGFIAQEVKNILPEAVSMVKDYIPDINKQLTHISWVTVNINDKIMYKMYCNELDMFDGAKYRFTVYNQESNKKILEIEKNEDGSFTFEKKWNNIYCYGKLVDDFHVINYDVIFSLYCSAIEKFDDTEFEINEKLEEMEDKIKNIEDENNSLENKLDELINNLNKFT